MLYPNKFEKVSLTIGKVAASWLPLRGHSSASIVRQIEATKLRGIARQTTADAALLYVVQVQYGERSLI